MRQDLTDVVVVLDRSGSMEQCKEDMQGGLNQLIKDQKKEDGKCNFTLVQFDTEYEFLYTREDIQNVPENLSLVPRGQTALLDAVGRAINETGERLDKLPESEKPALVLFAIITDGLENSSKEFTKNDISEMISHQENKYCWKFTYIGANQDSFSESGSIGITGQSLNFSVNKSRTMFSSVSNNISSMRSSAKMANSQEDLRDIGWDYNEDDRNGVK